MPQTADQLRTLRIRAIKAAERQSGIDEATHRALVRAQTKDRVESLKDCTFLELDRILDHLNRASGYKGQPKGNRPGAGDLMAKIEAQLTDMGFHWNYAKAVLKRVSGRAPTPGAGVDRLEWATPAQLGKVVAALAYEQEKRAAIETLDRLLQGLGKAREDVPHLMAQAGIGWSLGWERKPRIVKALVAWLVAEGRP